MSGWVFFAGILMILHGLSQAFLGISALVDKHYLFVTDNNSLILAHQHASTWGWVDLAVGVFVIAAGFSLLHGSNWARIFAIIFMGFSFLVNIAFLGTFPLWSILALIIDVFIIYALVVQHREV
jgi:hypothetical protein